jgi:hypothetical protein
VGREGCGSDGKGDIGGNPPTKNSEFCVLGTEAAAPEAYAVSLVDEYEAEMLLEPRLRQNLLAEFQRGCYLR